MKQAGLFMTRVNHVVVWMFCSFQTYPFHQGPNTELTSDAKRFLFFSYWLQYGRAYERLSDLIVYEVQPGYSFDELVRFHTIYTCFRLISVIFRL